MTQLALQAYLVSRHVRFFVIVAGVFRWYDGIADSDSFFTGDLRSPKCVRPERRKPRAKKFGHTNQIVGRRGNASSAEWS